MSKIFGIDLGTTYSCIAYVDEYGKPVTIPNQENSPVTPSVVFFETGENAVVGEIAKQALGSEPDLVCSTIKRQMGKSDYKFNANGVDYKPETVSSLILKKLAKDASEKLGEEVKDVVITCPAYFGLDEREATKKAGEIAGLNVLSIINEPTAAAVSYGALENAQTVMIYDLGGGTFDVTILEITSSDRANSFAVKSTNGDHNLGGKDWDAEIQSYAIDQYVQQTGRSADEIYDDTLAIGDLELKSEQAKKTLTKAGKTSFRINGVKIELTLEQFESMTANLLQSTIDFTNKAIAEANANGVSHIDKILLVGGSTFMPQVKKRLEQEFAGTPIEFCDPNESVARGAALFGQDLELYKEVQDIADKTGKDVITVIEDPNLIGNTGLQLPSGKKMTVLNNVISKSYALEFVDGIRNKIFRNTPIPLEVAIGASTVEANQTSVILSVYENNYPKGKTEDEDIVKPEDGKLIISDELKPLPENLPANAPIDVIMKIDEQGLLSVDARDVTGGRTVHMEVKLQSVMSAEEVEEAKSQVKALKLM